MDTVIYECIANNRERILSLWQAAALPQDYSTPLTQTAKSRLATQSDDLLKEEIEALLDWLTSEEEPVKARLSLQEICRLKAVQALNPSEALGFILDLKDIVRLVIHDQALCVAHKDELWEVDKRIDQLMLLAFDEYSFCREQIMEIRVEEVRRLGTSGSSTR